MSTRYLKPEEVPSVDLVARMRDLAAAVAKGRHAGGQMAVCEAAQVRRLTPTECERLQGFPDGHTLIPWRTWQESHRKGTSYEALLAERGMKLREPAGEECPDGPRYKALGNSMAMPVIKWIGRRILRFLEVA